MGGLPRGPSASVACWSVAAGATWTCVVASAPWAARCYHTSVVDAAGAIYVIGGWNRTTLYQDVWASTGKGASCTQGVLPGRCFHVRVLWRACVYGYARGYVCVFM